MNLSYRAPIVAFVALAAFAVALVLLVTRLNRATYTLRISAGDAQGQRHHMAVALAKRARREGLILKIVPTEGSSVMRGMMQDGKLDLALVQGGLGNAEGLTQVAALTVEPLHLLIRPGLERQDIAVALRGKTVNLSTMGSGTRKIALEVLGFAGLKPRDYRDSGLSYEELERLPPAKLPDAIFTVSLLPSPVVQNLVTRAGYRLMPIRFGASLGLRDYGVRTATIPIYAYGVSPAVPREDLPTVGTNLLLMARADVPQEAVQRLLPVLLDVRFAREAAIAPIDESAVASLPELPLHPGTEAFLHRNDAAITSDLLQGVDSFRNLIGSLLVAAFFGWRWWKKRNLSTLDRYFDAVTKLETETSALESEDTIRRADLVALSRRLGKIKAEALNEFTEGRLSGEEMMSGFLAHVADARSHLDALILHTRREPGTIAAGETDNEQQ